MQAVGGDILMAFSMSRGRIAPPLTAGEEEEEEGEGGGDKKEEEERDGEEDRGTSNK